MKKILLMMCMALSGLGFSQTGTSNLMPVPSEVKFSDGKFRIESTFRIAITGNPDERIYGYATRVLRRLDGRTGLFFAQDFLSPKDNDPQASLLIKVERPGKVILGEDESYSLSVAGNQVKLTAVTDIGAMRGLETFLQLLNADEQGYYLPIAEINDTPRFPWRGLMIDVCRHWLPLDVILRNIDGMAAVKMNVLHLHLTEDQGFRVESKTFPELTRMGSDGNYFTQEQIREIIKYAADRGIRVIPEFDIPGHATSWCVSHPELASAPGPYTIERHFGVFNPTLDPTKDATYQFLDAFLKEMAGLFTDEYMHIGGDENNGKQWNANPDIQAFMKANNIASNHDLQAYFNRHILDILTKYGKRMIGWDEILQTSLPKTIVIQSWRGRDGMMNAARNGYQSILSNGYYIDLIQPTDFHYLNDPLPDNIDLTPDQKKLILGGEATMWSEMVTWETVDSRIWPRTAVIAERLWSPSSVKDVDDMYKRLDVVSLRLEELGLTHEKNVNMMLRRMTGSYDIQPLRNFVDLCEPVKIYRRSSTKEVSYTSYSPYTRFVDATRPDPEKARNFNRLVDSYLGSRDKNTAKDIDACLSEWMENHAKLAPVIEHSPILKEVQSMSDDLLKASRLGLESMNYLNKKMKAPKSWSDAAMETIQNAKKARGQAEIMVIPGIEKLVQAAAGK